MKRAFTAVTFALALVALNSARPTTVSAQAAIDQQADAAGCVAVWCISCQTHHLICDS